MSERYQKSESYLARALKTIPLGSQTFSKSKTQFPHGVSPYFIEKGLGSHVWDIDGNEYIDFVNGLAAVTLGYCDPDVDEAVKKQMQQGIIFSLPHPIEAILAERIVEIVPSAEMVRFGKNGSDATAGAVRIARAYTGHDYIVVCGYHGWQDWYIGSTTRDLGVPKATKELTLKFQYNNIESLQRLFEQYSSKIAAVIMEPMNVEWPKNNFLQNVKELCHKNDAVFILDEMVTGFRFANGGAQEFFNVMPDLTCLGKGMGNGYPISAVAGKREIMELMEDVFFSFTFGGETLSMVASLAVLEKIQKHKITKKLFELGEYLIQGLEELIQKYDLMNVIKIAGHPSWSFLLFQDMNQYSSWDLKTCFMQEILKRGILSFGSHNLSYAHSKKDIQKLLAVYDEVFALIKQAIRLNTLHELLQCEPLQPLFKVR